MYLEIVFSEKKVEAQLPEYLLTRLTCFTHAKDSWQVKTLIP